MKRLRSGLLLAVAGLSGFVVAAIALQQVDPLRGVPDVKEQAHRALRHPDTTTIFIGSSLTRRGVDPAVFDRRLQDFGIISKSLNCGIDGMTMPEALFMVDQVLQRPSPSLKWLVLESSKVRTSLIPAEVRRRDVYWHTTQLTLILFDKLRSLPKTSPKAGAPTPWELAANRGKMWFLRFTNLGRITEFTQQQSSDPLLPPLSDRIGGQIFHSDERGFLGIDRQIPPEERSRFKTELIGIDALWASAAEDPAGARALLHLVQRLEHLGVRLILVQPPDTHRAPAPYPSLAKVGVAELNFMLPHRYPELYAPEHRYDSRHLNRKGAQLYSSRLAEAVAKIQTENIRR